MITDGPNLVLYVFSYSALLLVLFVFYGMLVALPFVLCNKINNRRKKPGPRKITTIKLPFVRPLYPSSFNRMR